jgi:nitrite reductase/ring-hydroxylating ferredoxin subunit
VSSQDVGPVEAFPEGEVRVVSAGRREVGVTCWLGQLYAMRNVCPHQRGPVCRGWLTPRLTATAPGTMELRDEAPVIACPWHGWEFDLRSGRALSDERYALRTYPVRVENGRVLVEL